VVDADLVDPTLVTAYEGDRPVYSALAIRGTSAWSTPVGTYSISRRVANETMSSDGLGIPRNAPGGYYVQNVLFTQYFTRDGAAIHYNYWSGNFGYPGSHGCLGMNYADSLWFWNWAGVGTPIVVHY
jgi:lipoprotein-anchoring transpeptidase ErfK/SrfK